MGLWASTERKEEEYYIKRENGADCRTLQNDCRLCVCVCGEGGGGGLAYLCFVREYAY